MCALKKANADECFVLLVFRVQVPNWYSFSPSECVFLTLSVYHKKKKKHC